MDERQILRRQYTRMASLLVFLTNAFMLGYIGVQDIQASIWYGSVAGAFCFVILASMAELGEEGEILKRKYAREKEPEQAPNYFTFGAPPPPQMPPQYVQMPMPPMPSPPPPPQNLMPEQGQMRDEQGRYKKK